MAVQFQASDYHLLGTSLIFQNATDAHTVSAWLKVNWTSGSTTKSLIALYGSDVPMVTGWSAEYFNNMTLTAPSVLTRIDQTIDFNWDAGSPDPAVNINQFSVRWTGNIVVNEIGSHTFRTYSDDGVRVWVNGTQVINQWVDQGNTYVSGSISLERGIYPVIVEYYENGGALMQFEWSVPSAGGVFSIVPAFNGSVGAAQPIALLPTTGVQIGSRGLSGDLSAWTWGGGIIVQTGTGVTTAFNDAWVHVAYTFDGTTNRLYFNGQEVANSTTARVAGKYYWIFLNGYPTATTAETAQYQIDAYAFYDRALRADEVQTIWQAKGNRHAIVYGLVARYGFDELAEGTVVTRAKDITRSPYDLLNYSVGTPGTAATYTYVNTVANSNLRPVQ